MRYLIKLEYDGTDFIGWQKQKQGRSIQVIMEKALARFTGKDTPIVAAGRTDAGVHALGQYAHFDYDGKMPPHKMLPAFRRWLPEDIRVTQITAVGEELSARYQAYERSYQYILTRMRTPFNRYRAGFIPHLKIHTPAMLRAAPHFLGKHDFSSFGRLNPEVPNHSCEIKELSIIEDGYDIIFTLRADRFLHNMVRRIVGTLVNISHFDLPGTRVDELLNECNPKQTLVFTAPACGLYLIDVKYPADLLDGRITYKFDDLIRGKA